jgi:hypothetical protein
MFNLYHPGIRDLRSPPTAVLVTIFQLGATGIYTENNDNIRPADPACGLSQYCNTWMIRVDSFQPPQHRIVGSLFSKLQYTTFLTTVILKINKIYIYIYKQTPPSCASETTHTSHHVLTPLTLTNNTVAYSLKARTVEPEKQPLLVNGSETFVSRQQP